MPPGYHVVNMPIDEAERRDVRVAAALLNMTIGEFCARAVVDSARGVVANMISGGEPTGLTKRKNKGQKK